MIKTRPTFTEAEFRKSSRSNPNKDCVLVARRGAWAELRDSKTVFDTPEDRRLVLTADQFDAFLAQHRR